MKANQMIKTLTQQQRDFLETKKIEAEMVPAEWFVLLEYCANFDREGDRLRNKALKGLIGGAVSILVALFLLSAGLQIPAIALLILGGLLIFNYWQTFMTLRKLDIKVDLKQFCLPVLSILREDMTPENKIRMTLDLRGNDHSDKQVREPQHLKPSGTDTKAISTGYRDQWFSGEAALHDGSRLRWRVVDDVQRLVRTRRSKSGKTKTKTKFKRSTEVYVQIKFPESKYRVQDPPIAHATNINALDMKRDGQTVKIFRAIKQNTTANALPPKVFMEAVGQAFKLAQPIGRG